MPLSVAWADRKRTRRLRQRLRSGGNAVRVCRCRGMWLKRQNLFCDPQTVPRSMQEKELLSGSAAAENGGRWGEYKYKNLLSRKSCAAQSGSKRVTDISCIPAGQGARHLTTSRDLYDNSMPATPAQSRR